MEAVNPQPSYSYRAVQREAFSLAGMLRVVKVFSPSALVRMHTNVNVFSLPKITDIATNIDVRNLSKPVIHLAKNSAEWLSKVVIETASAGVSLPVRAREACSPTVITSLNEARLTVIRVSNECCLGVAKQAKELTILKRVSTADPQSVGPLKKECVRCLESVKKNLPIFCFTVYGNSAPAKSGAGIGVPELIKAIHDAPSVFFCVVRIAHPFFSGAVIIRVAYQVMVGCSGAEKSAPASLITGYANPVQSTTSEIGVSCGGCIPLIKEAAIWLLSPPKNHLLSGDSILASNPAISLLPLALNLKPDLYCLIAHAYLLLASVQEAHMLNQFTVLGYGTNQRGLTIGINYKITSDSTAKATAHAMLQAQRDGLTRIRITRVMGATA